MHVQVLWVNAKVELPGCAGRARSVSREAAGLSLRVAGGGIALRQQLGGAQRSTTSPALGAVSILGFGSSHGPVEALSCFNLHFLDGASSHGLTFCLYLFSGEVSVRVFGPFY